jgi:hypothetical protein
MDGKVRNSLKVRGVFVQKRILFDEVKFKYPLRSEEA